MQNYQHLIEVLSLINQLPKSDQDCDFARIKEYYLDGRAGLVRQTIMVSNIHAPELNAVFSRLENVNGRVKINAEEIQGTIHSLIPHPLSSFNVSHQPPSPTIPKLDLSTLLPPLFQPSVQARISRAALLSTSQATLTTSGSETT